MIPSDQLKQALLQDLRATLAHLLPAGVERNGEWLVGSVNGESGRSMRIRLEGERAGLWIDAATGDHGDILKLWQSVRGLSFKETCQEVAQFANLADPEAREATAPSKAWVQLQREMGTGTEADIETLMALRRLPSANGLYRAVEQQHLFFGPVFDADQYHHSWIITDGKRLGAQARRMDGKPYADGQKGKTIHGTTGRWPIGINDCSTPEIALVEGAPDFLAAYTAITQLGAFHIQPVAMLGSGQSIHPDALPLFANKRVWMFPHDDANYAGLSAAVRWDRALRAVGATVIPFDFSPYPGVKDLNDFVTATSTVAAGDDW